MTASTSLFSAKTPPVDERFIRSTQLLGICRKTWVVNRPAGILSANEKLFAMEFPELVPDTLVSRNIAELKRFLKKCGGEMVVKPLGGKGGEGIFLSAASGSQSGLHLGASNRV